MTDTTNELLNEPQLPQEPQKPLEPYAREIRTLTQKMGDAYQSMFRFHMEEMERTFGETKERFNTAPEGEYLQSLLERPAETLAWFQLNDIATFSPEKMLERWEEVKQAALDEQLSGHRAASATLLPSDDSPMDRARFLAIRHDLALQWNPASGIEHTLIDQMAQAWTMQLFWQGVASTRSFMQHRGLSKGEVRWELPRVDQVEATDNATMMVDKWNKMFLRQLRALRDMRRYTPPAVTINNPGQVNIANQQVNASNAMPSEIGASNSDSP